MVSLSQPRVFVVDDDDDSNALVCRWLEKEGFQVEVYTSAEELLDGLKTMLPDVICLDLGLPQMGGLEALPLIRGRHRTVPVVIATADDSVVSVVEAMNQGAHDYLTKPFHRTKLITSLRNAVNHFQTVTRLSQLECEQDRHGFQGILGRSDPMRELFRKMEKVAASDITVLVHGESGTGKELVAQAIHEHSARSKGPFVAINCAAIPESLQDSVFFGHEKGAFTGAHQAKAGRFEQADGGTLFLDEVAELSLPLQAKLLRVLQERQFERIGGARIIKSDFRLVAATHRDLATMVRDKQFREDLYFRIAVLEIEIPPLRQREGDLAFLVDSFLSSDRDLAKNTPFVISPEAMSILHRYSWPGNVRELINVLQRARVIADKGIIRPEDLPRRLRQENNQARESFDPNSQTTSSLDGSREITQFPTDDLKSSFELQDMTLDQLERWAIENTLRRVNGNLSEAIRRLGISRTTLYRKLKHYGLR